ncbi:alpha/beta fold hydrolase [Acidocella aromatica]|uniref:2-hydroxymuconate-semialdehyde hydrolase n=1 Tax=Acidocella aromatica TaxID=1303579 RepID=A0A840VME3_9PROT|nr:alpha/beta fold hydrolase [Acidocella aromatica]MBB5374295.1 2-hydroxymuconate-semialdehyde hydrolase [Acidocella aromatica]
MNPEIGKSIAAGEILTNYHDVGEGFPAVLIHGSGPGVSAWANWRLNISPLAQSRRVIAPDMVGFGFTERPAGAVYGKTLWLKHLSDFLDALKLEQIDLVGNSFGGGLALAFALKYPQRVRRLVLMGSVGVSFPITPGLDAVWGYQPSFETMRTLLDIFAYDRNLVNDELAELRYRASIRPGFQESFSAMFPAPRQAGVDALASSEADIAQLSHETLIIHGREDKVIPPEASQRLFALIPRAELHMFGRCGHWTQIEHTDRFNNLVDSFLTA